MPGLHVFVVWSNARVREVDILADVAERFHVLEATRVEWSRERFGSNLTRLYGESLPDRSEKEEHCGSGPLLVVVARDERPDYGRRRTSRRRLAIVNRRVFDARATYRRWTGGGYRVHATLTPEEGARDLFLLRGKRVAAYADAPPWDGNVGYVSTDLIGFDGWRSDDELLTAVELTCGCVRLPSLAVRELRVLTRDRWWAALVAKPDADPWAARQLVSVAGRERELVLSEPGDGTVDPAWQRDLLERAERVDGVLVPCPRDAFHLLLLQAAEHKGLLSTDEQRRLEELAALAGVPPVSGASPAELEARAHNHASRSRPRRRLLRHGQ